MKPLREPNVLREEAATAREQAQTLHRAMIDSFGREHADWGGRRDSAQREALAARAHADAAHKQSVELTAESNRHAEIAGEYNAYGAQLRATDPVQAEEWFEKANGISRMAEEMAKRAEAASEAAQPLATRAEELEQTLQRVENEPVPPQLRTLENAADQLDDKARLLEEAAQQQRDALATGDADPGATAGSTNWARYALEKADAIQLDFTGVDPAVLHDAGIPLSQIPGSELMQPTAQVTNADAAGDDVAGAPAYVADGAPLEAHATADVAEVATPEFGGDDVSTTTFDDPVALDTSFQDFAVADDSIDAAPTEDMTYEYES